MTIRGPEQIPPPTLRLPTMGLSGWKNNLMACHLRYSHVPTETVRGSPRDYSDHPRTAGARSPPPQHRSLHSRDGSPPDINHVDFSDTMDRTQRHLKVPRISNYYQDPVFATKFATTGSSSWADDGELLPTPTGWATPLHIRGESERTATPYGFFHPRLAYGAASPHQLHRAHPLPAYRGVAGGGLHVEYLLLLEYHCR